VVGERVKRRATLRRHHHAVDRRRARLTNWGTYPRLYQASLRLAVVNLADDAVHPVDAGARAYDLLEPHPKMNFVRHNAKPTAAYISTLPK
jgi:hypothetical protein